MCFSTNLKSILLFQSIPIGYTSSTTQPAKLPINLARTKRGHFGQCLKNISCIKTNYFQYSWQGVPKPHNFWRPPILPTQLFQILSNPNCQPSHLPLPHFVFLCNKVKYYFTCNSPCNISEIFKFQWYFKKMYSCFQALKRK